MILAATAQTPLLDNPPPAEKIEVPAGGVVLPMGDIGGRPLVDVMINGKGPYRFILDTGASITVIGDDVRDELALPTRVGKDSTPADGSVNGTVRIDDLRAGDASLKGLIAAVAPLSRMFGGGAEAPRGVLSASAFPGYLLILDYPGKKVVIRKGELPSADSRGSFQYTQEQILPNVPVRVGGTEVRVHVDSGSPGTLSLPLKYMKELALLSEPAKIGLAKTPHGESPVWSAEIKGSVELGRFKLDLPQVTFTDVNPIPGQLVGNMGYQVLKQFIVTLDSRNRRIAFGK
jgi:hypothetical protein